MNDAGASEALPEMSMPLSLASALSRLTYWLLLVALRDETGVVETFFVTLKSGEVTLRNNPTRPAA